MVAWQAVLFAVLNLACGPTQELETVAAQPGCAVMIPAELTAGRGKTKKPKKPKKAHPSQTPCNVGPPTTLGLLVMYDVALLEQHTDAQIRAWIQERVDEANTLFANSAARRIRYELAGIRPVSARLPDTQQVPGGQSRVRTREILDAWVLGRLPVLNHHVEAYGADLAMLVTTPYRDRLFNGDTCGVATLPVLDENETVIHGGLPGSRPFGKEAFAVIEYQCGASQNRNDYTFAHELGHTLGMNHSAEELAENGLVPVLSYAVGHVPRDNNPSLATVMACRPDDGYDPNGSQVRLGVCNRIPHFSSPHVSYSIPSGCTGVGCQVVTGRHDANNAGVACARAPIYAAFREPPRHPNQPPTVVIHSIQEVAPDGSLPNVGSEVRSGTTVRLTAVATDPEDGNLTSAIEWLGPQGEVLGLGQSVQVRLIQAGHVHVSARVVDSQGLVDEWASAVRVTWPPDAFEPGDASGPGYAQSPLNSHQDRNFHVPGDEDRVISTERVMPGETIRVRLVPLGQRAVPIMDVELLEGRIQGVVYPLGSGITGELQRTIVGREEGQVRVRIRSADGSAGIGTDYRVHIERAEPQRVFPRVGPWYNPARDGHGIDLQRTSDGRYTVWWYTYRPDGSPIWYVSDAAQIEGTRWRGPLNVSTWNGSTQSLRPVGTLELSFSGDRGATFSWWFAASGIQGSEPFIFGPFDTGVTGVANGAWHPPAEPGWGISLWHMGNVGVITAGTYDASGQPTWAQGRAEGDPGDWEFAELYQFTARGLCPSCDGTLPRTLHRNVGTARFGLLDAAAGTGTLTLHLNYAASRGSWHRSNVPFTRLTAGP